MRRRLAVALAIALVSAACSTRSDRTTDLARVPTSLAVNADTVAAGCTFATGTGLGAEVTDVIPGGPAEGVLFADDVVVGFQGTPITSSGELVAAVGASAVGDDVEMTLERGGEQIGVEVTLRESPEAVGRPLLGVLVATAEDRRPPQEIAVGDAAPSGPLSRITDVEDELWAFDASVGSWSPIGVESPDGLWAALDGEVYRVLISAGGSPLRLEGLVSGTSVDIDLGGWEAQNLLTTLEGNILVSAQRSDETRSQGIETAVVAVDPVEGTALWAWIPDQTVDTFFPSFAFRSIDGARVLIALTPPGALTPTRYTLLADAGAGGPEATIPRGLPDGAVVIGWADETWILSAVTSIADVALTNPETGESEAMSLPIQDVPQGLWTAGDGTHLLIDSDGDLQMVEIGGQERRNMTSGCSSAVLSDWGF